MLHSIIMDVNIIPTDVPKASKVSLPFRETLLLVAEGIIADSTLQHTILTTVIAGGIFYHYSKNRLPKCRLVRLDPSLRSITWHDLESNRGAPPAGELSLVDINSIEGPICEDVVSYPWRNRIFSNSLSIATSNGNLELEAVNGVDAIMWRLLFSNMLLIFRRGQLQCMSAMPPRTFGAHALLPPALATSSSPFVQLLADGVIQLEHDSSNLSTHHLYRLQAELLKLQRDNSNLRQFCIRKRQELQDVNVREQKEHGHLEYLSANHQSAASTHETVDKNFHGNITF